MRDNNSIWLQPCTHINHKGTEAKRNDQELREKQEKEKIKQEKVRQTEERNLKKLQDAENGNKIYYFDRLLSC